MYVGLGIAMLIPVMFVLVRARAKGVGPERKAIRIRRVAAGMTALGTALATAGLFVSTANAAPGGAKGQDGTVKIEVVGAGVDTPPSNQDNDPHVDCAFQIVYDGVTSHAGGTVNVELEIQPPSSPTGQVVFSAAVPIDSAGHGSVTVNPGDLNLANTQANHTENGNNDSDKQDLSDPTEPTWHLHLDSPNTPSAVFTPKQKTFWVGGCEVTPTVATTTSTTTGPTTTTGATTTTGPTTTTETPTTALAVVVAPAVVGATTTTAAPTQVLGEELTRGGPLPLTGSSTRTLLLLAGLLGLLGGLAMLGASRMPEGTKH